MADSMAWERDDSHYTGGPYVSTIGYSLHIPAQDYSMTLKGHYWDLNNKGYSSKRHITNSREVSRENWASVV